MWANTQARLQLFSIRGKVSVVLHLGEKKGKKKRRMVLFSFSLYRPSVFSASSCYDLSLQLKLIFNQIKSLMFEGKGVVCLTPL